MEFRKFTQKDLNKAAELLAARHKRERLIFPTLQKTFEDSQETRRFIKNILDGDCIIGICAYQDESMLGFLLSDIHNDPSGNRCAFVEYEGLAIAEIESPELYRKLYAEIAKIWIKNGAYYHYVIVPSGYPEVLNSWLRLSFAYQQVYGIAKCQKSEISIPEGLSLKQADERDSENLRKVSSLIWNFQAQSPTFAILPRKRHETIKKTYGELPMDKDAMVLLVYSQEKLSGFIAASFDLDGSMMVPEKGFEIAICGTIETKRKTGVGSLLTKAMFNKTLDLGYENALVDWRIANLSSSIFWPKQGFVPIAYRMFRQVDVKAL